MVLSLTTLSLIACVLVMLLGFYFKRSIPMFMATIFLFWQPIYIYKFSIPTIQFHLSLSVCIPLTFLCFGLLKEKGIFNKSGFLKLLLTLFILILSFILAYFENTSLWILKEIFSFFPTWFKPVSHVGFLLTCITFLVLCVMAYLEKTLVSKTLPFSLLVALIPFIFALKPFSTPLFLVLSLAIFGGALIKEAYNMAYIDTLTKIPSRRAMDEYIKGLVPPFALCMVDIDHFKKFNDTYGHDTGDEVLRYIATQLNQTQGNCKVFRYGGEEFTIIFSKKFASDSQPFLEQTREKIAQRGFYIREKTKNNKRKKPKTKEKIKIVSLSVSMGLADTDSTEDIHKLFILADKALYKAKESGRNCLKTHN